MSSPKVFSLAVVKGQSKGEVLTSERKRLSVGSAENNDLVVADPDIAQRHFVVLIDQDRWRIHTYSPGDSITVDRRWTHPVSGKRGAIVLAAHSEILLFPGELEPAVIAAEIQKRQSDAFPLPEERADVATDIFEQAIELTVAGVANEPTVAMRVADSQGTHPVDPAQMDLVEMSQMPTIAGERPPDDLRQAARVRLVDERKPVAPSVLRAESSEADPLANQPVHGAPEGIWEEKTVGLTPSTSTPRKKRRGWDEARKPEKRSERAIPEVIAQPESQIMSLSRATGSSMSAIPEPRPAEAQVIELSPNARSAGGSSPPVSTKPSSKRNAWGDPEQPPPRPATPKMNAWGDEPAKRGNKWGDRPERLPNTPPPVASTALEKPGARALYVGRQIALPELLMKSRDPALQIVREPDGQLATSIRLLGTKIEEFARGLGYRAYMFTSAEPLTGKTTTICNLAFALAEDTHRRVALIEANFRYPRLSELLGLPEKEGIIPVLEGRAKLSDSVVKVKDRNLVVLPTGGRHPHPAEVLASPRFKTMIAELADTVDIALVDAPSVSPHADANLLLPLVDAAFLVVAGGSTKSIWVSRALGQLGEKRILGALYNRIPKRTAKEIKSERSQRSKA